MTKTNVLNTIEQRLLGIYWSIGYYDSVIHYYRNPTNETQAARLAYAEAAKSRNVAEAGAIKSLIHAIGAEYNQAACDAKRDATRRYWVGIWEEREPEFNLESLRYPEEPMLK
jgi:hypothetical protein